MNIRLENERMGGFEAMERENGRLKGRTDVDGY